MRDPNKNATFTFYCYEKESIDLKVRLRYDGLKQSEFFRTLLKMYVEKDPLMLDVVEKIKEQQKIMGKNKLKNNKKDYERSDQLLRDLGIASSDKDALFDLIEQTGEDYE
tara:strand:- start:4223 stop:4552 length:330 start_codon:yes stop_codon:yes gene_type:complete